MQTFIGLDVHPRYAHAYLWCPQTQQGRHLRFATDPDAWAKFIRQEVHRGVGIALEATGNAFWVHDTLAPHAGNVVVADPLHLKRYGDGRHSDRVDAERLAHMLALGTLRSVWVPPQPIRALRSLLGYRDRLVADRVRVTNRARALLRQQGVWLPRHVNPWKVVEERNATWPATVRLILESTRREAELLEEEIERITAEIHRWALGNETARRLMSLPGVGPVVAAALVAYVGEPSRFRRAKQVVRYAGLDPRLHQSGEQDRRGRIRKNGPPLLRKLLIQAAYPIVRYGEGPLAAFDQRTVGRLGVKRAIVALARKLLIAAWRLMQEDRLAYEADPQKYRRTLQGVEWRLRRAERRRCQATAAEDDAGGPAPCPSEATRLPEPGSKEEGIASLLTRSRAQPGCRLRSTKLPA